MGELVVRVLSGNSSTNSYMSANSTKLCRKLRLGVYIKFGRGAQKFIPPFTRKKKKSKEALKLDTLTYLPRACYSQTGKHG